MLDFHTEFHIFSVTLIFFLLIMKNYLLFKIPELSPKPNFCVNDLAGWEMCIRSLSLLSQTFLNEITEEVKERASQLGFTRALLAKSF